MFLLNCSFLRIGKARVLLIQFLSFLNLGIETCITYLISFIFFFSFPGRVKKNACSESLFQVVTVTGIFGVDVSSVHMIPYVLDIC